MSATTEQSGHSSPVYSDSERLELLRIAHLSIDTALAGGELVLPSAGEKLSQLRAAFTTLHLDGRLRGCVGYVESILPLYLTIAETARAAAFHDNRFNPVTAEEASRLKMKIEISVLSPLAPIRPEDVVVGKHGLVVTLRGRRGLLLPQVPGEQNWDRETFIAATCRKAGLPPDAVAQGATLEAFTAEVFGEE